MQVAHQKILELQNQRMVIMNLVQNARANILDNNSEEDLSDEEMLVSSYYYPEIFHIFNIFNIFNIFFTTI